MAKNLTAADLAVYLVEITTHEGTQTRTVRAAFDRPESGWLVFMDHQGRVVARFNEHLVVGSVRTATPDGGPEADGG